VLATTQSLRRQRVLRRRLLGATAGADEIVLSDPGVGVYKRLVVADDRLIGGVLFGDTADAPWYLDLIRSGSPTGAGATICVRPRACDRAAA
jgi:nitrite reductase (NADH) large subunit